MFTRGQTVLVAILMVCTMPRCLEASLDPSKFLTQYVHDVWTTANGLPQNSVLAMAQTPDGYLWLGTENGLARFDGVRFVTFDRRNAPALKSNIFDALLVDHRGDLWIGTLGGGLVRLSHGVFTSFADHVGLPNDSVEALYEDEHGDLWIGTDGGGLSRLHNNRFQTFTRKDGLADNAVFSICGDHHGGLWIGTHGGLSHWADGQFTNKTTKEGLPEDYVRDVYVDKAGTLWMGMSRSGLVHMVGQEMTLYTTKDGLSDNRVWSIKEDGAGSLWIGTGGSGGFNRFNGKSFTRFTAEEGFSGDDVWTIFEDREGSLWAGTAGGGLNRLRNGAFTTRGTLEGLSGDVILPVYQDREGDIWVGTSANGANRIRDGKVTVFSTRNGLPDNQVFSITEDGQGDHWFGTRGGLARLRNGKFTVFSGSNGLPNDVAQCTYTDSKGTLWVGTRGGLSHFDGRTFTTYTTRDGLSHNKVLAIYEDKRDGTLWVGTGNGLNHLVNGRFRVYTKEDGLSNEIIWTISGDKDGTLWLGSNGSGLYRFKNGLFTNITRQNGLFDDELSSILDDERGNLWFSCNRGVFTIAKDQLNAFADRKIRQVSARDFGVENGMRSAECNGGFQPAGWRMKDGALAFPTMKGMAVVHPDRLATNRQAPPVLIERTRVDHREFNGTGAIEPAAGQGQLEFQYTALSFIESNKIQFKYMLEGFDEDWTDAGTRRVAYYTNIPPGYYHFRVIARGANSVWSREAASVALNLPKHFYQTIPFICLEGMSFVGLMAGAYEIRVKQLRANEAKLVAQVEERTQELSSSEKKFRQLAENIREVFWIMDPQTGAMLYVSPAFDQLWGFSASQVLENPAVWFDKIHEQDRATALAARARQRAGEITECEYRLVHEERTYWVWDRAFPIHDQAGRLERMVGVVEDISEHKAVERVLKHSNDELEQRVVERTTELRHLNQALEKASKSKDEFLANMSHELRTPMNGVIGMTRLALATELNPEQREYLEVVSTSSASLLSIIDDILDFSKFETRILKLEKIAFDSRQCIQQTVASLAGRAEEKALQFECTLANDVPVRLIGDPGRLRQILINLLTNAIKFTLAGRVSTTISVEDQGADSVTLKFCVADTGIGIPKDKHAAIFEAFTQVDSSATRIFGGTGMGLTVAWKLVGLMGGRMWVESAPGAGSRFYFTAPFGVGQTVETPKAEHAPPTPSVPEITQEVTLQSKALRALLVEDNLINQKVAKRLLEKNGCQVHVANNGIEALKALEELEWNVDVVFMDVQMPEMDGIAATKEIRRLEALNGKRLPIFALTAHISEQDEERCLAAGMDKHLTKPIKPEILESVLRKVASGEFRPKPVGV